MTRPGITYQDVVTAAETLQAQQRIPTIENICSLLGTDSNGSKNRRYALTHTRKSKLRGAIVTLYQNRSRKGITLY
jgi:hypothetical protein